LANHQINHEASELFQRENLFMSLKLSAESHSHRIGRHIKDEGLPIIAEGDRARKFPNIVMTLALESSYKVDAHSLARWLPENRVPGVFVFACDDLPAVYKGFTHWSGSSRCYSERLDIAVDPRIGYAHSEARDGSPCCQPRLARLLEPLHHIHGIRIGSIFGLGSASLEEKIIDSMGAPLEESGAIAKRIARAFDQGDLARSSGDLRLAVVKYKDGLDLLDSPYREYDEDEIWENGPDSGQPICWYVHMLEISLSPICLACSINMTRLP